MEIKFEFFIKTQHRRDEHNKYQINNIHLQ